MAEIFAANSSAKKISWENLARRLLWVLIIGLILFCLGELIFYFFISPNIMITKIEINSDLRLTENEIIDLAGLKGNEYYFTLNLKAIEEGLESHPMVKEAIAEKIYPDTIRLTLLGRQPLSLVHFKENGQLIFGLIDEEGVLFEKVTKPQLADLPIISGLPLANSQVGQRLPELYQSLFKDLAELKTKNQELFKLISEIKVVKTPSGSYELVLYPMSYRLRIWIGKRLWAGPLRYLFFSLNFLAQKAELNKIEEADFRNGELVYTLKGEN